MTEGRVLAGTLATAAAIEAGRATSGRMLAFMFTDVEGSTRAWERAPAEMRTALTRHDTILRGTRWRLPAAASSRRWATA